MESINNMVKKSKERFERRKKLSNRIKVKDNGNNFKLAKYCKGLK